MYWMYWSQYTSAPVSQLAPVMRTFHHHLGVNLGVGHSSQPKVAPGVALSLVVCSLRHPRCLVHEVYTRVCTNVLCIKSAYQCVKLSDHVLSHASWTHTLTWAHTSLQCRAQRSMHTCCASDCRLA